MTSSEQKQNTIDSERANASTKNVEIELRCTYPSERRERNQIYILLNISNSVNEQEGKSFDYVNGTGWEDAVQGWSKTAPFAHLQLQKRARKARPSESDSGCLYCSDLMQVIDKCLEQDPKMTSDFRSSRCATTDNIPQKQQALLSSSAAITPPSAVDDIKKESYYGKIHPIQTPQDEKARLILKDVPSSLNERKFFYMKESSVLQVEKKAVPIKEFNILSPGKFKSIEAQKHKDIKSSDPFACNQVGSEAPATKPSLVLPPLKDAALKNNSSLDPSPKKSKTALSQASETTFHAVAETVSSAQFVQTKEQKCEKRIGSILDAVKEQIKMQEVASLFPRLSKASFFTRNPDQCYWPCAFLPDRKVATVSNPIVMRRNKHPNSMHFLHTKGLQASKASEIRDPCTGSRSPSGTKQGNGSKAQEIPLLSGLFPSLTERGWGRATPFACCKIPKKPRINKIVPRISHQKITSSLKKNTDWVNQLGSKKQKKHHKFPKKETVPSNREIGVTTSIKPYKMTTNYERERMRKKLNSMQTFLGEEENLPIKEYEINYSQQEPGPKAMSYNEINLPQAIHSNLSYITVNAVLVFRQDEFGVINIHLESPLNNGATAAKRTKREDTTTPDEMVSHRPATKKVKPKNRKKIGMNNVVEKSNTKITYHPLICPQDSGTLSFPEICWAFSLA